MIGRMSDAAELYDSDFYAWTRTQARELRRFAATRPNLPLDLPHLAEEIADLGNGAAGQAAPLDGGYHRAPAAPGAFGSAARPRCALEERDHRLSATRSPIASPRHLGATSSGRLPTLYAERGPHASARSSPAYGEHNVAARLPETCPYTLDQVLGDWWPDGVMPDRGQP